MGRRGSARTRAGPRTRGGASGRVLRPGPGMGKPEAFVRAGKARASRGAASARRKKQTAAGPSSRKRKAVTFETPEVSRVEEAEAPPPKRQKKRAPKRKKADPSSDLRYGGPFGGGADVFGWTPSVGPKELMPCSEGTAKSQPMRTRRMQDMEGVSTPYLMKPGEIVIRQTDAAVGYLGRGGCSLTDSTATFYASFLAPTRQMTSPHDFVVETARQLQGAREGFSFEVGKHSNPYRGCLGDIPGFSAWGRHLCARHGEALDGVGIRGAILATGEGFWKMPDVISAFVSFWSPATNSFLFPFGEMSLTLWDLKGICGLPIMGAPFDECTPSGAVLRENRLIPKIMDVLNQLHRGDNSVKYTSRCWVEVFGRISDLEVNNAQWPSTLGEFHAMVREEKKVRRSSGANRLWMPLDDLRRIDPVVELALFLWLWLSVVVCPSSARHGLVKWTCLWMACELAIGKQFALAPRVLCDVYKGLNELVYADEGPSGASSYFPAHFLIGWLGFYFPGIYGIEDVAQFEEPGVVLGKFACRNFANRSFAETVDYILGIGRFDNHFYKMAAPSEAFARNSSEECSREEKEFALALLPGLVTLREGSCFFVEPYFPQRFARQFGYDQDVPAELIEVSRAAREIGVGCSWWLPTSSRFEDVRFDCEIVFPGFDRKVHASYNYAYWYSATAAKAARCLDPRKRFFSFKPWDLTIALTENEEVNTAIRHSFEEDLMPTEPEHVLWIDLERAPRNSIGWRHHHLDWNGPGEPVFLFDRGPNLGNLFDLSAAQAHFYGGAESPGLISIFLWMFVWFVLGFQLMLSSFCRRNRNC